MSVKACEVRVLAPNGRAGNTGNPKATSGRRVCEFYDLETHKCKADGSAVCCFPYDQYCTAADGNRSEKQDIPSIILEIMDKEKEKQQALHQSSKNLLKTEKKKGRKGIRG